MLARIYDVKGRPLTKAIEVSLKIDDRGMGGRYVSGFFPRRRSVPFMTGDKFLLQFLDKSAEELAVDNPLMAIAFPKGDVVDFRPYRPLAL